MLRPGEAMLTLQSSCLRICSWSLLLSGGLLNARPAPSFPLPPDVRPPGCTEYTTDPEGRNFEDLKVSIIIPYRNERWEHIKGSVESILYYTPKRLLAEILFISDGNGAEAMHVHELRAMSRLVSVLALPVPGEGLIAAKMRGVGAVSLKAKVLLFLEPHIRVNRQWLEPLLHRIRLHPRVLAMPVLDPIPQDNFNVYMRGSPGHWRFEWNLNLIYTNPAEEGDFTSTPYPSPATSGGIFAIKKDWWDSLGFYDHGMIGWGGDHVEATFKVWRCGGHIEVVPCSRVGHLFRDPVNRPYNVEVNQVVKNYGRLAAVWFDDRIESFYKVKPETRSMDVGDLTFVREQRKRLNCQNMSWYLENVDREMQWEEARICIPGCDRKALGNLCCERPAVPGRSTIDRTIPRGEYRPLPHPDIIKDATQEL
mmetsp:Transcript_76358/g.210822  ORF Transcript_76358/g.210822 Transcript_76358/m.210822 type:complete len:423 (+) Transcript_76358:116-1384(+)